MASCPDCESTLSKYYVEGWIELICWSCGHYESNSPAYVNNPQMFNDIVRKNPQYFLEKFLKLKPADERNGTDESLHGYRNRRRLDGILSTDI